MASFFTLSETTVWDDIHCKYAHLVWLIYFLMNTDALIVLGILRVIYSAIHDHSFSQEHIPFWGTRESGPCYPHLSVRCFGFLLLSVVPVCGMVLNTAVVFLWYQHVLCDGTDLWNQLFQKDTSFVDRSRPRRWGHLVKIEHFFHCFFHWFRSNARGFERAWQELLNR